MYIDSFFPGFHMRGRVSSLESVRFRSSSRVWVKSHRWQHDFVSVRQSTSLWNMDVPLFFLSPATRQQIAVVPFYRLASTRRLVARTLNCIVLLLFSLCMFLIYRDNIDCFERYYWIIIKIERIIMSNLCFAFHENRDAYNLWNYVATKINVYLLTVQL